MEHHEWGWMIVVYLFLGGLGAGCMVLSGAAHLGRRGRYQGIARAGAILAPILVGMGSGLLIFDLGNPLRFWRLFVTDVHRVVAADRIQPGHNDLRGPATAAVMVAEPGRTIPEGEFGS